jgi:type VI secretion system protein ImpK
MIMNRDNPFADENDKTIFNQATGQNRSQSQPFSNPVSSSTKSSLEDIAQLTGHHNNPLVNAAIPLLSLIPRLQTENRYTGDIGELRNKIIKEIKHFEISAQRQGIDDEQFQVAHYALCTMLDETVLNTPWGARSMWINSGLLAFFHRDTAGGVKFFNILNSCLKRTEKYLHLVEFLYFCMCLGFQGRYRLDSDGADRLAEIRETTYQAIRRGRGDAERNLSLYWEGITHKQHELSKLVPLPIIVMGTVALLVLVFLGFSLLMGSASTPVHTQLSEINKTIVALPTDADTSPVTRFVLVALPDQKVRLKAFLKPEQDNKEVELKNLPEGKLMIRIVGEGLFESGSDEIMSQYIPLLNKISQALVDHQIKSISIEGHTDKSRISYRLAFKFNNNHALSEARAESVANLLKANSQLQTEIKTRGFGSDVPVPDAKTEAANRRVEIIL